MSRALGQGAHWLTEEAGIADVHFNPTLPAHTAHFGSIPGTKGVHEKRRHAQTLLCLTCVTSLTFCTPGTWHS